jgi:hypothetical protein
MIYKALVSCVKSLKEKLQPSMTSSTIGVFFLQESSYVIAPTPYQ